MQASNTVVMSAVLYVIHVDIYPTTFLKSCVNGLMDKILLLCDEPRPQI